MKISDKRKLEMKTIAFMLLGIGLLPQIKIRYPRSTYSSNVLVSSPFKMLVANKQQRTVFGKNRYLPPTVHNNNRLQKTISLQKIFLLPSSQM